MPRDSTQNIEYSTKFGKDIHWNCIICKFYYRARVYIRSSHCGDRIVDTHSSLFRALAKRWYREWNFQNKIVENERPGEPKWTPSWQSNDQSFMVWLETNVIYYESVLTDLSPMTWILRQSQLPFSLGNYRVLFQPTWLKHSTVSHRGKMRLHK